MANKENKTSTGLDIGLLNMIGNNQMIFAYITRYGFDFMQRNLSKAEIIAHHDLDQGKDCFVVISENDTMNADINLLNVPDYAGTVNTRGRNNKIMMHPEIVERAIEGRYGGVATPVISLGGVKIMLSDYITNMDSYVRYEGLTRFVYELLLPQCRLIEKPVPSHYEWLIPGNGERFDLRLIHDGHVKVVYADPENEQATSKYFSQHYWKIGNNQRSLRGMR